MQTTTTMREAAREAILALLPEAAAHGHYRNYHKLHVYRNGEVGWSEYINQSDDTIDRGADHFAAIPSVACEGTGSFACNCDWCSEVYSEEDEALALERDRVYRKEEKYPDQEAAIADAVADSDLNDLEAEMLRRFEEIPAGYFDDEETRG